MNNHAPQFGCSFNNMIFIKEQTCCLQSTFEFQCNMCNFKGFLQTFPESSSGVDINSAAALGSMNIGAGYTQMQAMFSSADIPPMGFSLYKTVHKTACDAWKSIAEDSTKKAAEEEAELAKECGAINSDGVSLITVVCDGS